MKRACSILLKAVSALLVLCLFAEPGMTDEGRQRGAFVKPAITAEEAFLAAKNVLPRLAAGKSFVRTGRRGEKRLGVTLTLDGEIVSVMRLNPATGEILPRGQAAVSHEVAASQEQAVKIVQQAIPNLEAASVRLGRHGRWKVDLTLKKMVVASIRVNGDGSILSLKEFMDEMRDRDRDHP